jgi:ABC-type antimicrobial peptide transport system permease subunit
MENIEKKVFDYFQEMSQIPHGSGNTDEIRNYIVKFAEDHGLWYRTDQANNIIIKSFTAITGSSVGDITIISFDLVTVLYAVLVVILISLAATVAPLIILSKIKPINIIKAKE